MASLVESDFDTGLLFEGQKACIRLSSPGPCLLYSAIISGCSTFECQRLVLQHFDWWLIVLLFQWQASWCEISDWHQFCRSVECSCKGQGSEDFVWMEHQSCGAQIMFSVADGSTADGPNVFQREVQHRCDSFTDNQRQLWVVWAWKDILLTALHKPSSSVAHRSRITRWDRQEMSEARYSSEFWPFYLLLNNLC